MLKFKILIFALTIYSQHQSIQADEWSKNVTRQSCTTKCIPGTGTMCVYNAASDQLHCASDGQNYRNRCIFNCNRMCDNSLTVRKCASRVGMLTCDVNPTNTALCPTIPTLATTTTTTTRITTTRITTTTNPTITTRVTTTISPTTKATELTTKAPEPTTNTQEPTTIAQEPSTITQEPTTITQEPTTIAQEPSTITQEPTTITQEPTTITQEPTTITHEPTTITQEPTTKATEPTTKETEPTTTTTQASTTPYVPPLNPCVDCTETICDETEDIEGVQFCTNEHGSEYKFVPNICLVPCLKNFCPGKSGMAITGCKRSDGSPNDPCVPLDDPLCQFPD